MLAIIVGVIILILLVAWYTMSKDIEYKRMLSQHNNELGFMLQGKDIRLSSNCEADNPDCHWAILPDGRIVKKGATESGIKSAGESGSPLKYGKECGPGTSNPNCLWTMSDTGRLSPQGKPEFGVKAEDNNVALHEVCAENTDNPDCLWSLEPFTGSRGF